MGTTTDKLNRLINTKEGIRQEINRAFGVEVINPNRPFKEYISRLKDHPFYLNGYLDQSLPSIYSDASIVEKYTFSECPNLSEASFPNATAISDRAFYKSKGLKSVSFPVATTIGSYSFSECSNLTNITSDYFLRLQTIGESAFYHCTNLARVWIPYVTSIGNSAFQNCYSLTEVGFPYLQTIANGSATWIFVNSGVFKDCSALTTLYIGTMSSTVCTLGSYAFDGCKNLTNIYVPASLVDSYKSATNWSSYADKIKAAP